MRTKKCLNEARKIAIAGCMVLIMFKILEQ